MKLIHTADPRLCAAGHAHLSPEKEKQCAAERMKLLEEMIDYAEKEGVDALMILGALFDEGRMYPHLKARIFQLFAEHEGLKFFCLPENEEALKKITEGGALPANLKIFDANWTQYRIGDVLISGVVMDPENEEAVYDTAAFPEELMNIVLLYQEGPDGELKVDADRLKKHYIDYLAVGPSVSYRMESMDERGILVASGSMEGVDYEEEGPHGFVLLEVNEEDRQISSHFIPFAHREFYTIPLDVSGSEDSESIIEKAGEALDSLRVPDSALVRLILTGEQDIESRKDVKKIYHALQPYCFDLDLQDQSVFRIDAERYANDASLKGEFVRSVCADEELTEEEKITVLRMGLQAIQEEEVTA